MAVSAEDARRAGEALGINWDVVPLETWRKGLRVELEHGSALGPQYADSVNITGDDLVTTGRIALAHLIEDPEYYQHLAAMEAESEARWEGREKPSPFMASPRGAPAAFTMSSSKLKKVAIIAALIVLVLVLIWYARYIRGGGYSLPAPNQLRTASK